MKQLESGESMASTKHVDIRDKFICDIAKKGLVKLKFVDSRLMLADFLTKTLSAKRMLELREAFYIKQKLEIGQEEYDDRGGELESELKYGSVTGSADFSLEWVVSHRMSGEMTSGTWRGKT